MEATCRIEQFEPASLSGAKGFRHGTSVPVSKSVAGPSLNADRDLD
jgi:hypothetical protein